MKPTAEELIKECRKGNRTFQRILFEQYAGRMLAICKRYCSDVMEAEDMLQIGFVKVFTKIEQYNDGSFEGWLKRIFINTCLTNYKYKKTFQSLDFVEEPINEMAMDGLHNLRLEDLKNMIAQLPEGAKVVFNLHAVEGYSHVEISAILGINESTSRAQLTRARQILQKKWKETFG